MRFRTKLSNLHFLQGLKIKYAYEKNNISSQDELYLINNEVYVFNEN